MKDDIRAAGIAAARAGDNVLACKLLSQVIFADTSDTQAWLWLGRCIDDPARKEFCFRQVLQIVPWDAEALWELDLLSREKKLATPKREEAPVEEKPLFEALSAVEPEPPAESPAPPAAEPPATPASPSPSADHVETDLIPIAAPIAAQSGSAPAESTEAPAPAAPESAAQVQQAAPQKAAPPRPEPAQSAKPVYHPIEPVVADASDDFWQEEEKEEPDRSASLLLRILAGVGGFLLGLAALGIPIILLLSNGSLDQYLRISAEQVPTPFIATFTPSATPEATATPQPVIEATPAAVDTHPEATAEALIDLAGSYLNDAQYAEAIPFAAQAAVLAPEDTAPLLAQAESYLALAATSASEAEFKAYSEQAIALLDSSAELEPQTAQVYVLRSRAYHNLAQIQTLRVDQDTLYAVALENLDAGIQLGADGPALPLERIDILFQLGRCDEGLSETYRLIDARPADSDPSNDLTALLAKNLLCLDRENLALPYSNTVVAAAPTCDRLEDQAIILYNLNRITEAGLAATTAIERCPLRSTTMIDLRALTEYELGYTEQAAEDLVLAESMPWTPGGLHYYVRGRVAYARGDTQDGAELLQQAEASIPRRFGTLMLRVLTELRASHIQVLAPTASTAYQTTPIAAAATPTPEVTP